MGRRPGRLLPSAALLAALLALSACAPAIATPAATATTAPTDAPSPFPTTTPTPAPTATPPPTAAPTPSPTPDPYVAGLERTVLAEGFYHVAVNDALKARITGKSYPEDDSGIPVTWRDLRYLRLLHYDFGGAVREGELLVHARLADEVLSIFRELYLARYPLTSVKLVDEFGGDASDDASMEADNTSAFNYRFVAGTTKYSLHSYGVAIDVNPLRNPYVIGDTFTPAGAGEYVDRTRDFPGKIDHDDLCYRLFRARGWTWGGDWKSGRDYQHFSKDLGYR